jgi:hypothetical protein
MSDSKVKGAANRDAGRLQALREKFERQADRCQEQERYEAMDIWRDAAADVRTVEEQVEAMGIWQDAAAELSAALHNVICEAEDAADALEALGDDGDAGMLRLQIESAKQTLNKARGAA